MARRRKLSPEQWKGHATEDFELWSEGANDFYWGFQKYYEAEKYKITAFQLHQMAQLFTLYEL